MNHHDIAQAVNRVYRNQAVKNVAKFLGQFLVVLLILVLLFIGSNEVMGWITGQKFGMVKA